MSLKFECEKVDVQDFLEALGVESISEATSEEFRFSCPFPGHQHGDTRPSAYMNRESTAWFCHSCKRKGNAISFLAEWDSISNQMAIRFLRERYGDDSPDPDSYSIVQELERYHEKKRAAEVREDPDPPVPEKFGAEYSTDWDAVVAADPEDVPGYLQYMLDRGFNAEALNAWEIGYAESDDRITIPIRNIDDQLVGFKARAWTKIKPKYMLLGDGENQEESKKRFGFDRRRTSRHVFGLSRALEEHDGQISNLILCEGELNVIAMWQMGFKNCAALLGSNFSESQRKQVVASSESITVFFDSDESGWTGTVAVVDELEAHIPIRVCAWHDFDAADCLDPDHDAKQEQVKPLIERAKTSLQIKVEAMLGERETVR